MKPQPVVRGLTHQQAAEAHAARRLADRYNLSIKAARAHMIDHLVAILAGNVLVQGYWPRDGKQLIHIPAEIDYFVIWDPAISRIVTYLPDNLVVRRSRGKLKGLIKWERPRPRAV